MMTTLFISHRSKDKAWAERVHKALSEGENGYQCLFLDCHPDDGIHVGAKWEPTLYRRMRQSRALVALCSADWLASPWCVAEAILARERGKPVFLVATAEAADDATTPRIPNFLKDTQLASLGSVTEAEALKLLLDGLKKEGLQNKDFDPPDRPYPGLEPFQEKDAAVYFGRDQDIDQVISALNKRRRNNAHGFIVVLGASGCGKSSLVRAGVLPRLRHANDPRAAWVILPPFMGGRGLDGLALSLVDEFGNAGRPRDFAAVRNRLGAAHSLRSLGNELLAARSAPEGAVLLVLDQMEEVLGTANGSAARAMLRLLLDASADAGSPLVVLATMRSDFLNTFQLFEVSDELCYAEVPLNPMPRTRFAEVIEGPAARFGLDLDPGLAQRMVADTGHDDALPLLAFALKRLHEEHGDDGKLTLAKYNKLFPPVSVHDSSEEVRGVAAAIKITADEILKDKGYADLPLDDERMRDLRRAFYSLAQIGEEGQFTRRTAKWKDLEDLACAELLKRFADPDKRLLVWGAENGERILSVAHEALFRVWDTLDKWLRQDRAALALRQQLEEAAATWQQAGRTAKHAWSDERVIDAVRIIEKSGVSLADVGQPDIFDAFLGPTNQQLLESLPSLDAEDQTTVRRYGDAWRLPLSHTARASVGVRLAAHSDRRKGVRLLTDGCPGIAWIPIKGGQVTIKILKEAQEVDSDLLGVKTKYIEHFEIAKYPITVVQYKAFIEDVNGWRDTNFWGDDLFRDPNGSDYDFGRFDNHPAIRVNWFDAVAFTRWLSRRLGYTVRLPDEWEWQQAATNGDERNVFPWGAAWNPVDETWRANTFEGRLGRATAVGMYPKGRSAAGVLDMGGGVWDWCINKYSIEKVEMTSSSMDDFEGRVLRGGAWNGFKDGPESTRRYRHKANFRSDYIGFRVVRSSPSPVE